MNDLLNSVPYLTLFVFLSIADFLINHIVELADYLSVRKKSFTTLPSELLAIKEAGVFTEDKLTSIRNYKKDKYFLWLFSYSVTSALLFFVVVSGFLPYAFNLICRITGNPNGVFSTFLSTFFFSIVASLPVDIASLPFSLIKEFYVEKKHGFSKMTIKLWIVDTIKSIVMQLLLSALLFLTMSAVIVKCENDWHLIVAIILTLFILLLQVIYPVFLAPLFNKFTPLEEGSFKNKIINLMKKAGIKCNSIYVVDGSRRSGHSNAYFTGFGGSKRIVLYDTLLKQLTEEEVIAVLSHEAGHYKCHHITKRLVVMIPFIFLLCYVIKLVTGTPALYTSFGFSAGLSARSLTFIGILLFSYIISPLDTFIRPLSLYFSRRDEYQADKEAKKIVGEGSTLISALIKLNSENLSEVNPAPLYVLWNYTHPALKDRVKMLEEE